MLPPALKPLASDADVIRRRSGSRGNVAEMFRRPAQIKVEIPPSGHNRSD